MTEPTRQEWLRAARHFFEARVAADEEEAAGLPAASKAKWLLEHMDVVKGRAKRRARARG